MTDILSQKEIDALLGRDKEDTIEDIKCNTYEFDNIEEILNIVHKKVLDILGVELSSVVNSNIKMRLHTIQKITYDDFLILLPEEADVDSFFAVLLNEKILVNLDNSLAFSMVNMLLGGEGEITDENKNFSDIEVELFKIILTSIMQALREAFESTVGFELPLEMQMGKRNNIAFDFKDIDIFMVVLEVDTGNNIGMINLYYPFNFLKVFCSKSSFKKIKNTAKLEIDLCDIKLNSKDILKLKVGDIIKIGRLKGISKIYIDGKYRFDSKISVENSKKSAYITDVKT